MGGRGLLLVEHLKGRHIKGLNSSSSSSSTISTRSSRGMAAGGLSTLSELKLSSTSIYSNTPHMSFFSPSALRLVPRLIGDCLGDGRGSPSLSKSFSVSGL